MEMQALRVVSRPFGCGVIQTNRIQRLRIQLHLHPTSFLALIFTSLAIPPSYVHHSMYIWPCVAS